jgi:hypothetical protein
MPQMDYFRRPLLAGKNLKRLTSGTIRGSIRRNDADATTGWPYFPGISANQTLIIQTETGTYTATLPDNLLLDIIPAINTALGVNGTAFDADGTIGLRTSGIGGAGWIQVTGGSAATALGFDTTLGRNLRSSGGDVDSAPEGRLGNIFGTAFPGIGEDFKAEVFQRALARISANVDVLFVDLLREVAEVQKITGAVLDATGLYVTLPATSRVFNGYVSGSPVLTRLSTVNDLAPFFAVVDSSSKQLTPYKVNWVVIGTPAGNGPFADASSISDTATPHNVLGLNLSKFGPTAITAIREGRVVTCTGAGTALAVGDIVQIASATNTNKWSNNGMKWAVEQIIDANNIVLRPIAQSTLTQLGVTLNDTQPVLELADDLQGAQSYGTLQGFTGSFTTGVKLVLNPPAPSGASLDIWVAQPLSIRTRQSWQEQMGNTPFTQSQSPFIAGSTSQVPLAARRFSAGSTGDILQIQNQAGTAISKFGATGALTLAPDGTNTDAITATGTGTGRGLVATGGGTLSADGILGTGGAAGGRGVVGQGVGSGMGGEFTGGASGGHGVKGTGGTGNANGVIGFGSGSSAGILANGGATGPGGTLTGGATSGAGLVANGGGGNSVGVSATGNGSGAGVSATGGSGGTAGVGGSFTGGATGAKGIVATGTSNNNGGDLTGNGTGVGVLGTGGATNATGVRGVGGATNGIGVSGAGTGSGNGGSFVGGATGIGVSGQGGATSGVGGSFTGGPTSDGVQATGGSTGAGGRFTGTGNHGVIAFGGNVNAAGILATGGTTNGPGVDGRGAGAGIGVTGTGGPTGIGVAGFGGATSGVGGSFTGGPNSNGVNALGAGTGVGVQGTGGTTGAPGIVAIAGSGNTRGALNLTQQATPSAPSNGDLWNDGTEFNVRLSGVSEILARKSYVDGAFLTNLLANAHSWAGAQTFSTTVNISVTSGAALQVAGSSGGVGISASATNFSGGFFFSSAAPAVSLGANNTRGAINFTGQTSPSAPVSGDLWWDPAQNAGAGAFMYKGANGTVYAIQHV